MPAFRGKDVVVEFNSQDISGDGRSVTFEGSADALDTTAYGDAERTYVPGLTDGQGSFEALDVTGAWATYWTEIAPGTSATMSVYPEGNASTKRRLSFTAIITGRTLNMPYDDLVTISMQYQISGAITEDTVV